MNSSQAEAQLLISVAFGGIRLSAHSWPGTIHPFKIVSLEAILPKYMMTFLVYWREDCYLC